MVGADIVEVAPAYDGVGEQTALTAAQLGFEIITSWVGSGLKQKDKSKATVDSPDSEREEL